jgi:fluoroacetyl-CoA thioesterase
MHQITVGLRAERIVTVDESMTAQSLGSGSLPVYSTAAMIALMEATSLEAIEHLLQDGLASVGTKFDIQHHAATPVGEDVRVQAEVIDVKGPRVVFDLLAWDDKDLIGEGTHIRLVIDTPALLEQLTE